MGFLWFLIGMVTMILLIAGALFMFGAGMVVSEKCKKNNNKPSVNYSYSPKASDQDSNSGPWYDCDEDTEVK